MNINYIDEELNLKYDIYDICIKISKDYNNINIKCFPKYFIGEIYEYIMSINEFNNNIKIFNEKEKFVLKNYFDIFNQLFEEKKVIIEYDPKLYSMKLIFKLDNNKIVSFNLNKKFNYDISKINFKSIPDFIYKETLFNKNFGSGFNSLFDVYINYIDSKSYFITSNYENCDINVISLENNILIKELKGHKHEILSIRYFLNEITKEEYIISSDIDKKVIVWNIHENFNIEFNLYIDYSQFCNINSCIITNIQQLNYVIISCYNNSSNYEQKNPKKDYTRMYSLMNKDFIKEIYNTEANSTRYMLSWYNESDENTYIIELCDYKITINNLLKKQNYSIFKSEFNNKEEFLTGFIYKKEETDYLITGSWNGFVRIWDLDEKSQINYIQTDDLQLYNIIPWSDKCAIIAYKFLNKIKIIDFKYLEIVSEIESNNLDEIKTIKKIIHPLYGESLITCSEKGIINLFILN